MEVGHDQIHRTDIVMGPSEVAAPCLYRVDAA